MDGIYVKLAEDTQLYYEIVLNSELEALLITAILHFF